MKKQYYSIGEVCNLLDLKPHIIRYWETEFTELRPRRTKGDTRRYTIETIELLKTIRDLLYVQKFTIKGVKKKLSNIKSDQNYQHPIDKSIINEELKDNLIKTLSDIKQNLENVYRTSSLT